MRGEGGPSAADRDARLLLDVMALCPEACTHCMVGIDMMLLSFGAVLKLDGTSIISEKGCSIYEQAEVKWGRHQGIQCMLGDSI